MEKYKVHDPGHTTRGFERAKRGQLDFSGKKDYVMMDKDGLEMYSRILGSSEDLSGVLSERQLETLRSVEMLLAEIDRKEKTEDVLSRASLWDVINLAKGIYFPLGGS